MTITRNTRIIGILSLAATIFVVLVASALGSWTVLGGDPVFKGGIKGSGQTARNDFAQKSRTAKFNRTMKTAGLNPAERRAVRRAISRGQFTECRLKYGDVFVRMAFGANGTFVDRNVTFLDPDYKGTKGAKAFCLTVKVKVAKNKFRVLKIKIPWICVNFGLVSRKTITIKPKPKVKKSTPQPQPAPQPVPQPQPTPPTPPTTVTPPKPPAPLVDITASPAHAYVNGSVWIFAMVKAASGYDATLTFDADYGTVSGKVRSDTFDKQPCPSGWICYRAQYWAPKDPVEKATVVGFVQQNDPDGQYGVDAVSFEVKEDDFGRKSLELLPEPTIILSDPEGVQSLL